MDINETLETLKAFLENSDNAKVKDAILELHPALAESKDEKIRKKMVEHFKGKTKKTWCNIPVEDIISYLEKQKELPFVKDVMLDFPAIYFYDGERMHFIESVVMEEGQKEQKYFWSPTKEDVTLFDKAVTTNTSLTPQDRAKLDLIRMKFKHRPNIEQKEQKSDIVEKLKKISTPANEDWFEIEWSEDGKKSFVDSGFLLCVSSFDDFKAGETYWLEYLSNDNYSVRSDNLLARTYHITPEQLYSHFKKYIVQKPYEPHNWPADKDNLTQEQKQEWSEGDSVILNEIIDFFENGTVRLQHDLSMYAQWLKSLRPQQKQEWSEKDSKRLLSIGAVLETSTLLSKEEYDADMAWIRELVNVKKYFDHKAKQEWDKEDKEHIESILHRMDVQGAGSPYGRLKEDIIWLQSLLSRPKPSGNWKPTKDDKRILKGIIGFIDHDQHYGVSNEEMVEWLKKTFSEFLIK